MVPRDPTRQHATKVSVTSKTLDVTCLDDLYVISSPELSVEVHNLLREELWRHSKISLHQGKTCIWNRGALSQLVVRSWRKLQGLQTHERVGVWRGSHDARLEEQGITILGTPVGRPEFGFWPTLANPFSAIVFGQPILANPFLAQIRG